MERDEDTGWYNPKVLAILAVIFLCGGMCGAVGMRAFLHKRMPMPNQHILEAARSVPPAKLAQQLNLTADQQKAIGFQLDEYAKYYQNIEEERSDVARHGIDAIRACLTEEQRRLFDKMFESKH